MRKMARGVNSLQSKTGVLILTFINFQMFWPWPQELDRGQRYDKIKIVALARGLISYFTPVQFNYMLDKGEPMTGTGFMVAVPSSESI